jgi:hypothetical protein
MHALAKFGLATVLVTFAVLSNVLVTLSALSGANAQIQGRQPEAPAKASSLCARFCRGARCCQSRSLPHCVCAAPRLRFPSGSL